ncbi:uncharacterized protein METZ01_LOCUS386133, partial [marine metagenome]
MKQAAAIGLHDTGGNLTLMIQGWELEQVHGAASRATLGIGCAEYNALQAAVY